jgi:hypothetical protein
MMFYEFFFPVAWVVFILHWQVKAGDTKATQRLEPAASRVLRVLIFLIAIALLSIPRIPLPWIYEPYPVQDEPEAEARKPGDKKTGGTSKISKSQGETKCSLIFPVVACYPHGHRCEPYSTLAISAASSFT